MQDSTLDLPSLAARIEKLEKQMDQAQPSRTLVTEKLVLTDASGKTRASLRMTEEGPGLDLYDANGNLRASLGVSAEGPALRLWDAMTEQGLSLMVDKDGPVVCLREVKGNTGVMVTAGKVGPAICLSDANGKHRLILDVSPFESGTPGLTMRNANGMATVVVRTLEDGPSVGLFDPANEHGNTAVRLQVDSDGPSLRCLKDGKVLWSAT